MMPACTNCHTPLVEDAAYCPHCGTRVEGVPECTEYVYEAFVSYRHLPHDTEVATAIQRNVEGFRIPKELRGRTDASSLGTPSTRSADKLGRLFRDEDELPTSSSLSSQIEDALRHSRYLVVVCTPATRESRWVAREVELFSSYHGRDRVLVALAEAEPPESFPDLLLGRKVVHADGSVRLEPTEPLAADFRDKAKYRQESLRIVATLLGCGYDDLRQRQRARRNALAARIGAGVAAVSLAFAGFSAYQQAQIVQNQRALQVSQSRFLAQEVDDLLDQGKRMQAVQAALEALPESAASNDRPYVPEAQNALERALQTYRTAEGWYPRYSHTEQADVRSVDVDGDAGLYAVLDAANTVHVYRIATGELAVEAHLDEAAASVSSVAAAEPEFFTWKIALCGPHLVAYQNRGSAALCFDANDGSLQWSHVLTAQEVTPADVMAAEEAVPSIAGMTAIDDGSRIALVHSEYAYTEDFATRWIDGAVVLDAQTGEVMAAPCLEVEQEAYTTLAKAAFDESGENLAVSYNSTLALFDLNAQTASTEQIAYQTCEDMTWAGPTLLVASSDWFATLEDEGDGSAWPCALQGFDAQGAQLWSVDDTLTMLMRKTSLYTEDIEFWSDDLDGDGSHARVLASLGCDLLAIDATTGETEILNTFGDPICCAQTGGTAESRGVHVCTSLGTITFSGLENPAWGESKTDTAIEEVGQGWFAAANSDDADDWGFLVSTSGDLTDQRTTTVRALCANEAARTSGGLKSLTMRTINVDRTLLAATSACSGYRDAPEEPALYVLDASSFEPLVTLDGAQMTQRGIESIWQIAFSADDPDTLLVVGQDEEGTGAVCVFDARTGELQASRAIEGAERETAWVPCAGTGSIVTFESNYPESAVVLLDPHTLDEVSRAESELIDAYELGTSGFDASCGNGGVWSDGDVIAFGPGSAGTTTVLDLRTGDPLASDFTACDFAGESITFHDTGEGCFAVGTTASGLSCFDMPAGTLRWSCEIPQGTPSYLTVSPDGDTVVVQASGSLLTLDAATGNVRGTSSKPFGTVQGCSYSADGETLYVQCQMASDSFGRCTLHVIRLDDSTLTPASSIDYGVTVSTDGDDLLVDDSSGTRPSTWVLPYLSLDELIAQGREQIAGFELTDQERRALMLE